MTNHRTKIVATIGPASNSPEIIEQMVHRGMNVARLNFSHGSYEDHARTIELLRVSTKLTTPITILQDLQGPKIRVGQLPKAGILLKPGTQITLVPETEKSVDTDNIAIDYPYLAEEAIAGTQIHLDDGLLELEINSIQGKAVL